MLDPTFLPAVDPLPHQRARFSLDQANRSLPYVSRVVQDIQLAYEQVVELRHELEHLDDGSLRNLTESEYETSMDRLGYLVDELHETGGELRDFELGRVEFPATVNGRQVMLTWQAGEIQVAHWRPIRGDDQDTLALSALFENEAA